MDVQINDAKSSLSEQQLLEVEQLIGFRLPQDYKDFLLRTNGGIPKPDGFIIRWRNQELAKGYEEGIVESFLAIHDGKYSNLINHYKRFKDRIPRETIAVAYDPGGNLILLGLGESNKGIVYYWASDYENDEADYENVGFVANSFTDFLNSLHPVK